MKEKKLVIYKSWRSEYIIFICIIISIIASFRLSHYLSWSVIQGELISIGNTSYTLSFPLFWFVPFGLFVFAVTRIYDVRYYLTSYGIEKEVGILSFMKNSSSIRYEDIRSVEATQSITDRILNIGQVSMGTSSTNTIEIVFKGVSSPFEVQQLIQSEKDKRIAAKKENKGESVSID